MLVNKGTGGTEGRLAFCWAKKIGKEIHVTFMIITSNSSTQALFYRIG